MPSLKLIAAVCLVAFAGCRSGAGASDFLIDTVFESLFHGDEDEYERVARQDRERVREYEDERWKQYWRDNPEVNPRMTEAFENE